MKTAARKARPRALAHQATERWNDMREKSNEMAENVLGEITGPGELRAKEREFSRRAKNFWKSYRMLIVGAAATAVIAKKLRKGLS